jgi:hypothetical protein
MRPSLAGYEPGLPRFSSALVIHMHAAVPRAASKRPAGVGETNRRLGPPAVRYPTWRPGAASIRLFRYGLRDWSSELRRENAKD